MMLDRLARFEREAKVLASLNYPNIAALYGIEQTAGRVGQNFRATSRPSRVSRAVSAPASR